MTPVDVERLLTDEELAAIQALNDDVFRNGSECGSTAEQLCQHVDRVLTELRAARVSIATLTRELQEANEHAANLAGVIEQHGRYRVRALTAESALARVVEAGENDYEAMTAQRDRARTERDAARAAQEAAEKREADGWMDQAMAIREEAERQTASAIAAYVTEMRFRDDDGTDPYKRAYNNALYDVKGDIERLKWKAK